MEGVAQFFADHWLGLATLVVGVPGALLAIRQFRRRRDESKPASTTTADTDVSVVSIQATGRSAVNVGSGTQATASAPGAVAVGRDLHIHEAAPTGIAPVRRAAQDGDSPVYGVPPMPSQHFVGREPALRKLQDFLLGGSNVRITASVEGLAGIGKTELATQLVHRLSVAREFRGGIYWFDAENPDLTPTWGGRIADDLCLPDGPQAERANAARATAAEAAEPVLVLLDNVTTWTSHERPGPLPEGPHVRLLVTTRQRDLGGPVFTHFDTDLLDEDAARTLLITISGRRFVDEAELRALLTHLQGHALSLQIAGATLRGFPEMSPETLLQTVHEDANWGADVVARIGYRATVGATFKTLWERLDADTRNAWRLAACFEPASVSVELSDCAGLDNDARSHLRQFSLIRTAEDGRWVMHRATRAFVRSVSTDEEARAAWRAFVGGCVERSRQIDLPTGFRVYSPDRAHFESAFERAPSVLEAGDPRISDLGRSLATALQSLGEFQLARQRLEQALASDLSNLGEDHPNVAISRAELATVLLDLGDPGGAKPLLVRALASNLRTFDEDHPSVAGNRGNLAVVLMSLGDLKGAKSLFEQALASDLRTFGEDHPKVALRRSNLAQVLRALGDPKGAKPLLVQALASHLRTFGEEHPNVTIGLSNLALVFKDLGDFEKAKALLEQVLASALHNMAEGHPKVAIARSNLAMALLAVWDPKRAKPLLEQALASDLSNLGEDHPDVAIRRWQLAEVLQALGDLGRAKHQARLALEICAGLPDGSDTRVNITSAAQDLLGRLR